MTRTPTVYVVHWPQIDVVKVGFSEVGRWKRFVSSGATVVHLYEFDSGIDALHVESWLQDEARAMFPYAFPVADDMARIMLGHNGAGYAECWKATAADVDRMISRALHRAHAQVHAQALAPSNATYVRNERTNRDPWLSPRDRLTVSDARARIRITHLDPS